MRRRNEKRPGDQTGALAPPEGRGLDHLDSAVPIRVQFLARRGVRPEVAPALAAAAWGARHG